MRSGLPLGWLPPVNAGALDREFQKLGQKILSLSSKVNPNAIFTSKSRFRSTKTPHSSWLVISGGWEMYIDTEKSWELGWINGPEYIETPESELLNKESILGVLRQETGEDNTGRGFTDYDKELFIESIMVHIEDEPEAVKEILRTVATNKDAHPIAYQQLIKAVDDFVERGGEW